jgi:hypothetical protein
MPKEGDGRTIEKFILQVLRESQPSICSHISGLEQRTTLATRGVEYLQDIV